MSTTVQSKIQNAKIKIKYTAEEVLAAAYRLMFLLPLNRNRVVFSSFSGRQYSDSPLRISEYLLKNAPQIKQVWAFTEPQKFDVSGVKKVKYKSLKYMYYVATSAFYVDNVEPWSLLRFRKNQTVIETWHGGGAYKGVGNSRIDIGGSERNHVVKKMNRITDFVSSSKAFTDYVIRGSYFFNGNILSVGLPRNDELVNFNPVEAQKTKAELNIPANKKIVLYAPTFRNSLNTDFDSLNYSRLTEALTKKFGGEWLILKRFHYYQPENNQTQSDILDVTNYPDMQRLMAIADVLITDYSSVMWDFSLLYRPCFLFAPDLESYCNERSFYTPVSSWPFDMAYSNENLYDNICRFDENEYKEKVKRHHCELGSCETGRATEAVSQKIISFAKGWDK